MRPSPPRPWASCASCRGRIVFFEILQHRVNRIVERVQIEPVEPDALVRLERRVMAVKPFDERAQVVVSGSINRPPMERTDKVLRLYEQARAIAGLLDFDLGEASVGGASDGNFVGALGVAVLDGLGIEGDGAHASHEHIIVDNIALRGALLAGLIASL